MNTYPLLNQIDSPSDLKGLDESRLPALCGEIREFLCDTVLRKGGHLASNLGVVEMTVALHRVFDFSRDRLIFDVGHQSYTHKLLTGRREHFDTLRQRGGLSGFTKRSESEYDPFGAGHSSTSVSAALGFAEAERLKGTNAYTVAVLGDGAFTGGMVHEALNNCRKDLKLIIILNENEMSISRNTGAFADHIARLRASKGYYGTKRRTVKAIKRIPLLGDPLFRGIRRVKQWAKDTLFKSNYFEDLGFYYLGPADGNDLPKVERLLREAVNAGQSTVIHLRTVKGKGYEPAEKAPGSYHSVAPEGKASVRNFSAEAGEILTEMASDPRVCAVTAAMADGTGLTTFGDAVPDRFFDVGIAEEHALTFSAGLAADGFKPYFAVYSSFLQRGYDNVIHDIALQKLPVTLLVDRAGLSDGDGPTHHGIFDVAFLSQIPNVEIYTPSTLASLREAMNRSLHADHPVAIRYPNGGDRQDVAERFLHGNDTVRADFSRDAMPDAVIVTYGRIVTEAMAACDMRNQEKDASCGVLLLEKLKPYGEIAEAIEALLPPSVKKVIFLEEGIANGGAGMILREKITLPDGCAYHHLAIDDVFDTDRVTGNIYADFGIGREDVLALF
ncbi:MAG: 1-deoxy-D-xylulose-5-phosphate synthase [Clostridia bacterium]|nr:1-deoxy-D-xylulose-5-phosphate synthase [Clostridia bacterium]